MFHVIEPDEHHSYQHLIDPFLKNLQETPILYKYFQDIREATFLLAQDELEIIQGGVLMTYRKTEQLHTVIQKKLYAKFPGIEEVLAGTISIEFMEGVTSYDIEDLCKAYYRIIYGDLVAFGVKEEFPFVCLTLTPMECFHTEMLANWPYLVELLGMDSFDGLFHGILPITGLKKDNHPRWG